MVEYTLSPSPPRMGYRTSDALSPERRLYAMMLNETIYNQTVIMADGETAVGHHQLKLTGDTKFVLLGSSRLAVL